ncbi:MAG TPA: ABC transporter permease [Verrucomicrobiae bacterium]
MKDFLSRHRQSPAISHISIHFSCLHFTKAISPSFPYLSVTSFSIASEHAFPYSHRQMQFLSVAGRELRVAARKRSSFRVRIFSSVVALFICGFSLWFVTLFRARPLPGEQLFYVLSWFAFFYACIVGPALTADSVNEEYNNGTLGLLFLTNLNSTSISLGKLVGHGLLALYSIISILPIMALPLLLGGTDLQSLARTSVVLIVTLILSLVVGMFASTVCRKTWVATVLSLFILGFLVLGVPLIAALVQVALRRNYPDWLDLFTPAYSLYMSGPNAAMLPGNRIWTALGVQMLIALAFFTVTNLLLPSVWKEGKTAKRTRYISSAWHWFKYGPGEARRKMRTRLLQMNPILWLSCRERFGPFGFAAFLLLLAFGISWAGRNVPFMMPTDGFLTPMIAWIAGLPLLYLAFCFRFAAAASERFAVDRKAGALELITCTPITTRQIIRGHWLGLLRRFWGAALLLFALHAFTLNYIIEATRIIGEYPSFNWVEFIVRPVGHLFIRSSIPNEYAPYYVACLAVLSAAFLITILWFALGWLGMALSLKLKRQILAPWIALILLAAPPIPIFICALPFIVMNKQLFVENLFVAMFRMGFTGFTIVLANALLWLFLAHHWTYRTIRPSEYARKTIRKIDDELTFVSSRPASGR